MSEPAIDPAELERLKALAVDSPPVGPPRATPTLPPIEDFEIPRLGLTLRDQRNAPRDQVATARKLLVRVLASEILGSVRPTTELCGTEQPSSLIRRYGAAERAEPGITFSEFIAAAGNEGLRDDSDTDPRLPIVSLLVFERGTLLGLFTLYNIKIEKDDARGLTASAMAMPGVRAAAGLTVGDTWAGIMRHILEHDLELGGRLVDFIEWRFPTREGHRWRNTPPEKAAASASGMPEAVEVIDPLAGHDIEKDPDGAPVRIRRAAYPPEPEPPPRSR